MQRPEEMKDCYGSIHKGGVNEGKGKGSIQQSRGPMEERKPDRIGDLGKALTQDWARDDMEKRYLLLLNTALNTHVDKEE